VHARHCSRLGGIDLKPRMRVGRPQDDCMQRVARRNVTDIADWPKPNLAGCIAIAFTAEKFACRNYSG